MKDMCYLCKSPYNLHTHHMLHGSMKNKADQYNLTITLCVECHTLLHDHGFHDKEIQQLAQKRFEETHTREEFIKEFGKSFL